MPELDLARLHQLGRNATDTHGCTASELRELGGLALEAETEVKRLHADLAAVVAANGDDWRSGYDTGCAMSHSLGCQAVADERDVLVGRLAEVERERDELTERRVWAESELLRVVAERDALALSDSLDKGEIVDVLTDAGLAPADHGGTIKSTIEFLIGLDRITTAKLAAAEARLEAVRKFCADQTDAVRCSRDAGDNSGGAQDYADGVLDALRKVLAALDAEVTDRGPCACGGRPDEIGGAAHRDGCAEVTDRCSTCGEWTGTPSGGCCKRAGDDSGVGFHTIEGGCEVTDR